MTSSSAIVLAIIKDRGDLVQLLLSDDLATNLSLSSSYHFTNKIPLMVAIDRGSDSKIMELLLKHGSSDLNHLDSWQNTPLSLVCSQPFLGQQTEKLRMLLKYENGVINPNTIDIRGSSPLLDCATRSLNMAEFLVAHFHHRLNLSLLDHQGWSILHHVIQDNRMHAFKLIMDLARDTDQMSRILDMKVPLTGDTPLHIACSASGFFSVKNTAIVERLLEAGSDVNATNTLGWTPLITAVNAVATYNNEAVIDILVEKGKPDLMLRNNEGKIAAEIALERQRHRLSHFLACRMSIKPLEEEEAE